MFMTGVGVHVSQIMQEFLRLAPLLQLVSAHFQVHTSVQMGI